MKNQKQLEDALRKIIRSAEHAKRNLLCSGYEEGVVAGFREAATIAKDALKKN